MDALLFTGYIIIAERAGLFPLSDWHQYNIDVLHNFSLNATDMYSLFWTIPEEIDIAEDKLLLL
jgi:hypothetical protein